MKKRLTLREFVKKRNGVPLGGKGSLPNMLRNALGASSFDKFWQYWNPIWGYFLSVYVMKPLVGVLPFSLTIIFTFAISGGLHDLAILLLTGDPVLVCTPWFTVMGLFVVITKSLKVNLQHSSFLLRALCNISLIVAGYLLSRGAISWLY